MFDFRFVLFALVANLSLTPNGWAQEETDSRSEQRLAHMQQRIGAFEAVSSDGEPLAIGDQPLLRYNDAIRGVVDATMWPVGDKGRPSALIVLEVYDNNTASYEFTATATMPRSVSLPDWSWVPQTNPFKWRVVTGARDPVDDEAVRARQMKLLARRFQASETFMGSTSQLRLMPRPLHRYSDADRGVVDGMVFIFAIGTNAEALMFLEAQQSDDDSTHWVAGFSRLATAELNVTYEDTAFWDSPQMHSTSTTYYGNVILPLEADEATDFQPAR